MKCGGSARARPAPASRGRPLLQEEPRYQLVEGHSGCTFLVLIARRRPVLDSVVVSITYPALVTLLPALTTLTVLSTPANFYLHICCFSLEEAD